MRTFTPHHPHAAPLAPAYVQALQALATTEARASHRAYCPMPALRLRIVRPIQVGIVAACLAALGA